tara:strand:+ start:1064 stop:1309 length:246 start_codon:yes stop_codon:yes gene_type:complete
MAKNREASQFNSYVNVNDSNGQVGIANSVGINTTTPQGGHALYVQGTSNITGDLTVGGSLNISGTSVATEGDIVALAIALG